MDINKFKNIEDAIWSCVKNHKRYDIIPHALKKGEKAEPHYHRKANEWLIISNGKFLLSIGDEQKQFDLNNQIIVVRIPRRKKHSLVVFSKKIKYFVIRDKADRNIYIRKERRSL